LRKKTSKKWKTRVVYRDGHKVYFSVKAENFEDACNKTRARFAKELKQGHDVQVYNHQPEGKLTND